MKRNPNVPSYLSPEMTLIESAVEEAERFLSRAKEHYRALNTVDPNGYTPLRTRSATRRSSMDLSRALADLRRRERR